MIFLLHLININLININLILSCVKKYINSIYIKQNIMDRHADMLMRNYPLMSDSSDNFNSTSNTVNTPQNGGAEKAEKNGNGNDFPTGGFIPLFICDKDDKREESVESKERAYSTNKSSVSIKEIMEKRRSTTPFISLK
jgi:hypothetical protein